jgi:hypothetical protein
MPFMARKPAIPATAIPTHSADTIFKTKYEPTTTPVVQKKPQKLRIKRTIAMARTAMEKTAHAWECPN